MSASDITIVATRPGRDIIEITQPIGSLRFTTVAVGGYGSCSFTLPGPPDRWRRDLPDLTVIEVRHGTHVVWQGRIEDRGYEITTDGLAATFTAFGWRRILEHASVQRIWKQALTGSWVTFKGDPAVEPTGLQDTTKQGVAFVGNASTDAWPSPFAQSDAYIMLPQGPTIRKVLCQVDIAGTDLTALVSFNATTTSFPTTVIGAADSGIISATTTVTIDVPGTVIRPDNVSVRADRTVSPPGVTSRVDAYDFRILGTATADVSGLNGGFYAGTVLQDLIALIPELAAGNIDPGNDFLIQQITAATRRKALEVVEEVSAYHVDKRWQVWEDGRFDWQRVNLDEPHWQLPLASADSLQVEASVDQVARTVYLAYQNAITEIDQETSAASTDPRNPFVKHQRTKDIIVDPGFPMVPTSAAQLAARWASDAGKFPTVRGRATVGAFTTLPSANGPAPAIEIRAGQNLLIPELPRDDPFQTGRDGQTLFLIASTECDLSTGTVTLELEGQTRRIDALLARLAAATRVVTGG